MTRLCHDLPLLGAGSGELRMPLRIFQGVEDVNTLM
jgi:hypothetical protein